MTGAARGIGAALARRLHARGARLALVGLEPDRLAALADELGGSTVWFEADVTDSAALERAVRGTVERFGGIDIAVANAGIHAIGSLLTAPPERVERTIEVNLLGVWRTDRAVLGELIRSGGYLLNVASLAAAAHLPLMGPYAASKAGVEALTDSLRVELTTTPARAGCAYFGFVDTDLVRGSFAHPSSAALNASMPGFIRAAVPVEQAIDAIERAIVTRARRTWAPRWVGPALALRGVLQPVFERRAAATPGLAEALALADPAADRAGHDPTLGVSVPAPRERD